MKRPVELAIIDYNNHVEFLYCFVPFNLTHQKLFFKATVMDDCELIVMDYSYF